MAAQGANEAVKSSQTMLEESVEFKQQRILQGCVMFHIERDLCGAQKGQ